MTLQEQITQLQREKAELERLGQESLASIQRANEKITSLKEKLQAAKQKHTNYLNSRRTTIQNEITLLRNILGISPTEN